MDLVGRPAVGERPLHVPSAPRAADGDDLLVGWFCDRQARSRIRSAFPPSERPRISPDFTAAHASSSQREIVKTVKDAKLKVQASIQGDFVRIAGKDRDTLQAVIKLLRDTDFGIDMQFINYRSN